MTIKKWMGMVCLCGVVFCGIPAKASLLYSTLKDGFGIRALSMGNAYTAIAEGGQTIASNPAGLAQKGLSFSYENLDTESRTYSYFSSNSFFLGPLNYSSWKKEDKDGGSVEVSAIGFGKKGTNGTDWGLSYKAIKQTYGETQTTGWTADLGVLVHANPNLNFGISAHDFVRSNAVISPTLAAGLCYFTPRKDLVLSGDVVIGTQTNKSDLTTRYGVEYEVAEGLKLRGGWNQGQLSAGVEVSLSLLHVNYGVIYPSDDSGATYMLGFEIGKPVASAQKK